MENEQENKKILTFTEKKSTKFVICFVQHVKTYFPDILNYCKKNIYETTEDNASLRCLFVSVYFSDMTLEL